MCGQKSPLDHWDAENSREGLGEDTWGRWDSGGWWGAQPQEEALYGKGQARTTAGSRAHGRYVADSPCWRNRLQARAQQLRQLVAGLESGSLHRT